MAQSIRSKQKLCKMGFIETVMLKYNLKKIYRNSSGIPYLKDGRIGHCGTYIQSSKWVLYFYKEHYESTLAESRRYNDRE